MEFRVAIIGLGYVGLPLAVESGKKYETIGFDINQKRISELQNGIDRTLEVSKQELLEVAKLTYSYDSEKLANCNFYIVTVPTPIDQHKNPDLTPILRASELISTVLSKGDVVVYESTVYPGCTEEVCVPILEKSGLKFNKDFFCGYSPERINPGDKVHRLPTILKVTSGSTPEIANIVDDFYSSLVTAGTFKASSIRVAEAAKVIENSQRDINIAFVNELSLIFNKLGIDTNEVLEAAGTKWNFLKFSPGLVGGHCIGVDPYYLTYKAESVGYHPQVILAGRRINDNMGAYVAKELIKLLNKKAVLNQQTKVLILGITFKENCPDIRNSRVIDIYNELVDFGLSVDVMDTEADPQEVFEEYGIELTTAPNFEDYQGMVLAVAHKNFMDINWPQTRKKVEAIFDVKGLLPKDLSDSRL